MVVTVVFGEAIVHAVTAPRAAPIATPIVTAVGATDTDIPAAITETAAPAVVAEAA